MALQVSQHWSASFLYLSDGVMSFHSIHLFHFLIFLHVSCLFVYVLVSCSTLALASSTSNRSFSIFSDNPLSSLIPISPAVHPPCTQECRVLQDRQS